MAGLETLQAFATLRIQAVGIPAKQPVTLIAMHQVAGDRAETVAPVVVAVARVVKDGTVESRPCVVEVSRGRPCITILRIHTVPGVGPTTLGVVLGVAVHRGEVLVVAGDTRAAARVDGTILGTPAAAGFTMPDRHNRLVVQQIAVKGL